MPCVVGMPFQNRQGSVHLFRRHHQRKLMRKSNPAKGNHLVRTAACRFAPAVRWANRKHELLPTIDTGLPHMLRQLF